MLMNMRNPLILLTAMAAAACGGGSFTGGNDGGNNTSPDAGPTSTAVIQSFTASAPSIALGATVQLTATFTGGTGVIDHQVGTVQSGVPVTVTPTANTTWTLIVTDPSNVPTTASATVLVTGAVCIGKSLLSGLGKTKLLTGFSDSDNDPTTPAAASWDLSYRYLAGGLFAGSAPCTACNASCNAPNQFWWGCFDGTPGGYALDRFTAGGPIPWFTYYEILQASGAQSFTAEVGAVNDANFSTKILADLQFLFKTIGNRTAFVHVEPDFWGFAQNAVNADPTKIPAQVQQFPDCASQPNTLVGFARCIIAMSRKYSPNVRIGLHGSTFATGTDISINKNPAVDVAAEAKKLATFMKALGADAGDFIAVDASDRDYAYYALVENDGGAHTWDTTNQTLPNFHQDFTWAQALAENLGLPVFYWQIPMGNAAQNNTDTHYKDNRVDYFYAHPDELAAAHVAGMLFGAGDGHQTNTLTDGGNLVTREKAYLAAGGQALCQ
jgi:hypothetical protein